MRFSAPALVLAALAGRSFASPVPDPADEPGSDLLVERSNNTLVRRSYIDSCRNCNIYRSFGAVDLVCNTCYRADGSVAYSSLELGTCIGNQNGALIWQYYGGFQDSCYAESLGTAGGGHVMYAICNKYDGTGAGPSIDLNERIHNSNGQLWCQV